MKFKVRCTRAEGKSLFSLGKVYTWDDGVLNSDSGCAFIRLCQSQDPSKWQFVGYEFEHVADVANKIVITSDGSKTTARLFDGNSVIKSAEAKCSPSDTFDFATGANLAYDRLMRPETQVETKSPIEREPIARLYCVEDDDGWLTKGKTYEISSGGVFTDDNGGTSFRYTSWDDFKKKNPNMSKRLVPLVSRPAKVGEWVYVNESHGDYLIVIHTYPVTHATPAGNLIVENENGKRCVCTSGNYYVLDGYQPKPKRCECCGQIISEANT